MSETWTWVPGYQGKYEVSDLGRVRSHCRGEPKILRPGLMSTGHLSVCLGKYKSRCVHEIVATSFLGERPSGNHVVRHLNGVHTDNRLSNLEWATYSVNGQDIKHHGGARHHKLSVDSVRNLKADVSSGRMTEQQVAEKYSVSKSTIQKIKAGRVHADL